MKVKWRIMGKKGLSGDGGIKMGERSRCEEGQS